MPRKTTVKTATCMVCGRLLSTDATPLGLWAHEGGKANHPPVPDPNTIKELDYRPPGQKGE